MQPTALSMLACPVITITSSSGRSRAARSSTSRPLSAPSTDRPARRRGSRLGERGSAASADSASAIRWPSPRRMRRSERSSRGSSSISSTSRGASRSARPCACGSDPMELPIGCRARSRLETRATAPLTSARPVGYVARERSRATPLRCAEESIAPNRTSSSSTTRSCIADRSSAFCPASAIRSAKRGTRPRRWRWSRRAARPRALRRAHAGHQRARAGAADPRDRARPALHRHDRLRQRRELGRSAARRAPSGTSRSRSTRPASTWCARLVEQAIEHGRLKAENRAAAEPAPHPVPLREHRRAQRRAAQRARAGVEGRATPTARC